MPNSSPDISPLPTRLPKIHQAARVPCIMLDGKLYPTSFCSLTVGSMLIQYQTDALKATQPAEGKQEQGGESAMPASSFHSTM